LFPARSDWNVLLASEHVHVLELFMKKFSNETERLKKLVFVA
jgi:hypothetical protein